LLYRDLTQGLRSIQDKATAYWKFVSHEVKYKPAIQAKVNLNGEIINQKDFWLYPAETINVRLGNCVCKSFLLTSLLMNEMPQGSVYCGLGELATDAVGGHAWCEVQIDGEWYIVETTQPNLPRALVPADLCTIYTPYIYFDSENVYSVDNRFPIEYAINMKFGICKLPFLEDYLCERCLKL
jgi:hypothetical protein